LVKLQTSAAVVAVVALIACSFMLSSIVAWLVRVPAPVRRPAAHLPPAVSAQIDAILCGEPPHATMQIAERAAAAAATRAAAGRHRCHSTSRVLTAGGSASDTISAARGDVDRGVS
jgi:hypothetical protein